MTLRLVAIAVTMLSAAPSSALGQASPASAFVGIWSGRRDDTVAEASSFVDLHLDGPRATACIGARSASAAAYHGSLAFHFADGNELRVRVLPNSTPTGQWIQAASGQWLPFATPVKFAKNGNGWVGRTDPIREVVHVALVVRQRPDGSVEAYVRNPEFNQGVFYRMRSLTVSGTRVALTAAGQPDIAGSYDGKTRLLSMDFPEIGRVILRRTDAARAVGLMPTAEPGFARPQETGDGWKTASLSDVGIDETKLGAALRDVSTTGAVPDLHSPYLHSLLIARHGNLVFERYFYGFDRDTPHDVRSAGKSITTLMVGRALERDTSITPGSRILPLFAQYAPIRNDSQWKREMTLADLMTMSSGLACDDNDDASPGNENTMQNQTAQPDWYKYTLDLPMTYEPGTGAEYCTADINLLGGVIARATHEWLPYYFYDTFAAPMQFEHYGLWLTPAPLTTAYMGGGDYFRPRDVLKFGQLFLSHGRWNGKQIIDEAWLRESVVPRASIEGEGDRYGYGWHLTTHRVDGHVLDVINAGGNGGQLLVIVPALDLAVVMTAGNYNQYRIWGRFLRGGLFDDLLKSVRP